jgi:hypothetical protein
MQIGISSYLRHLQGVTYLRKPRGPAHRAHRGRPPLSVEDGGFGIAAEAAASSLVGDGVQLNAIDEYAQSIIATLKNIDLNSVTPMDALNLLYELRI